MNPSYLCVDGGGGEGHSSEWSLTVRATLLSLHKGLHTLLDLVIGWGRTVLLLFVIGWDQKLGVQVKSPWSRSTLYVDTARLQSSLKDLP